MLKVVPPGQISVKDPVRVNEAFSASYIQYNLRLQNYPSVCSLRRYNDFLWLVGELARECPSDCVVPSLSSKRSAGRFEPAFVETRRKELEVFINKVAKHIVFCQSTALEVFLLASQEEFARKKSISSSWFYRAPSSTVSDKVLFSIDFSYWSNKFLTLCCGCRVSGVLPAKAG